jgi:hypothetical protein
MVWKPFEFLSIHKLWKMAFLVVNIDKGKKGMHQRIHLFNLAWYTLTNLDPLAINAL